MTHPYLLTLYRQAVKHRLIGAWQDSTPSTLTRIGLTTDDALLERLALMAHAAINDHDLTGWQPHAPKGPKATYSLRARRIDDRRYIDQGFARIFAAKAFLNLLTHDHHRWNTPLQITTPSLVITSGTDNLEEIADYRLTASERAFIFPEPYLRIYMQFLTPKINNTKDK